MILGGEVGGVVLVAFEWVNVLVVVVVGSGRAGSAAAETACVVDWQSRAT